MLEIIIAIILAPVALVAAIFTVALGAATVKALFKRKDKDARS